MAIRNKPKRQTEVQYIRRNNTKTKTKHTTKNGHTTDTKIRSIPDCRKCGYKFIRGHLSNCLAKNEVCRICKKIGHYAKMCKAEMPPRPTQRSQLRKNTQSRSTTSTNQNNNYQQNTRRVRDIKAATTDDVSQTRSNQSEEDESINPESTCYIREMMEDSNNVNLVKWKWSQTKINKINQSQMGEYWIETQTGKWKIHWLVDTGSPRIFESQSTAIWLINKLGKDIENKFTKLGEFRCFNNNKKKINSTLNIN